MNPSQTLVICSGANSQLATPFLDYFKKQIQTKILHLFNSTPVDRTDVTIPVQVDLTNKKESEKMLLDVLTTENFTDIETVYFLHMIGSFKYEGKESVSKIDDDVFKSNIVTFENTFNPLISWISKSHKSIKLSLFNIGSKRDYDPDIVPWPSYSMAKNILRKKFEKLSSNNESINALFVNASTIDILKERELRPYGEHNYWLSVNEVFEKSITELEHIQGYKEIEIYKKHPNYQSIYQGENLDDTHNRWVKEMGIKDL